MKIRTEDFGVTAEKEPVTRIVMTGDNGMEAAFLSFGAVWQTMLVPDGEGVTADIQLGFDTLEDYEKGGQHYGAPIGRVANRIANASFELNGKTYPLTANNHTNNLHSGPNLYRTRVWDVKDCGCDGECAHVTFHLSSPDGDQGFPGNLEADITYSLNEAGELGIRYEAVSDADTLVNFTNHSYFNLAGHENQAAAMDQLVKINSTFFTPASEISIPTGEFRKVEGTPFDFREFKALKDEIDAEDEQIRFGGGYDHNYMIDGEKGVLRQAAVCKDPVSGRYMETWTDLPAMQLYTCNIPEEKAAAIRPGKGGARYARRGSVCFETQYVPDAVHQPVFDSCLLKANEKYDTRTVYKFGCGK